MKNEIKEEHSYTNTNQEKEEVKQKSSIDDNAKKQKEIVPQVPTKEVPTMDVNTAGKS